MSIEEAESLAADILIGSEPDPDSAGLFGATMT